MEKETVIEIEFIPVWDKWAWRITKNELFGKEEGMFEYTNKNKSIKFIRGYKDSFFSFEKFDTIWQEIRNDSLLSQEEKEELEFFVKQANEEFGKTKRWRAERNGEYYCINDDGNIHLATDDYISTDDGRYTLGNYFKTREEAKKALERVKKALQEVEE